ncbi:MAG: HAD-IC family P-type ATPase [Planctomycetes bacterium]|nr:HAD-IC family P-type ATPase [Planctomycetota bacterium]
MNDSERAWHALAAEEALAALSTTADGLPADEATRRRAAHGPNLLPAGAEEGLLALAWRQINNPISWVLVVAGVLAIAIGKGTDAVVVFGAVFINAAIGFVQEWRAGRAIAALTALVPERTVVLRGGRPEAAPAADLVPGDVIQLQGGDKVPADVRLLALKGLAVDEAALTGESVPVPKRLEPVAADADLGDRLCMGFGGTLVTAGTAAALVVATGASTELGRISALLQRTERLETPITRQLTTVSAWIAGGVVAVAAGLLAYGLLVRQAPAGEALLLALALAVAAIPEGLPAIITIALAIGVSRMAARRAVIRHLPAVETLGSTSVICTDKTGTLTRNEMTVQALWTAGREFRVSGVGWVPVGRLERDGKLLPAPPPEVTALLRCAALCNDAALRRDEAHGWAIAGDPTEAALVVAARKVGLDEHALRAARPRLDVLPFESQTMFMATLDGGEAPAVHVKGGLEQVLARCDVGPDEAAGAREAMEALASQGMRVLAFAARPARTDERALAGDAAARGLGLLGLVGMIDPPRTEAIDAIRACQAAGIDVKMITGDHPVTAAAIGRALGLLGPEEDAAPGAALERLDEAGLRRAAAAGHVFARVAPAHKLRLVEALQAAGHVVAMTGDGVNDAPALKRADIGVAMGITGTSAAKEAAKVVLTDDNFASIAAAVEEGRRVYDNLVKALAFVLPTNLGIALILVAAMLFFPSVPVLLPGDRVVEELLFPMSPTQILWINLVSSVALSVPFAFEVLEPDAMRRRPRPKDAPIFSAFVVQRTLIVALLMAAGACGLFLWEYLRLTGPLPQPVWWESHRLAVADAQTTAVTTVICFQAFYLLECRSLRESAFTVGFFRNPAVFVGLGALLLLQCAFVYVPPFQALFGSVALEGKAWLEAALAGLIVVPVIHAEKRIRKRRTPPAPA